MKKVANTTLFSYLENSDLSEHDIYTLWRLTKFVGQLSDHLIPTMA